MTERKYWILIFASSLVIVTLIISQIVLRDKFLLVEKPQTPAQRVQPVSELAITVGQPINNKDKIGLSVLNKVTIDDVVINKIRIGNIEFPKMDLSLSFIYQGSPHQLLIPVIEKIDLLKIQSDGRGIVDQGIVSISEIPLRKGQFANIGVLYALNGKQATTDELKLYCVSDPSRTCLPYIDLEFGKRALDPSEYFSEIFKMSGQIELDREYMIPAFITIFP